MKYEESKQLLIKSLRSLSSTKACILYGDKKYTAAELAKEIEDETELGKKHIELCMKAMKKAKFVMLNQPPKK